MDFLNDCLELIEMVGNGLANFVDFFINLPTLLMDLLEMLPYPLYSISGVFIGFFIVIIFVNVIKMFFVK